ncbi:MAG: DUF2442 domain-containing protein [Leptospiraceae bacterium]|nr:DUF2442 domain-containing protein [Leptospiraceae bacterium]
MAVDITFPLITAVELTEDLLVIELADGRSISAPIAWFPRLVHANPTERQNWRLIAKGQGIHWIDLDEDISAESLIMGKPSAESQQSFQRWLAARNT